MIKPEMTTSQTASVVETESKWLQPLRSAGDAPCSVAPALEIVLDSTAAGRAAGPVRARPSSRRAADPALGHLVRTASNKWKPIPPAWFWTINRRS